MNNEDRAEKLLEMIRMRETGNVMMLSSKEAKALILAYAMEIRQEAEMIKDIAYCEEMIKMTQSAVVEWQRRLGKARYLLALAKDEKYEQP
jgi:hypothetical protein